ncbi:MAG: 30S ribosomal protein S21 [bacterium (Candidatus Stahlbacteria) CG23_combo_of_CG06-09_8_20_14_all_34_7]|nr:MAG: 30S ribosomal protein S21 [bacterium (Candidatus Stahlbacteria) CG23_combo_of_CG06-09_8_20_14_all_34_7]
MAGVRVKEGESFDSALKRFKRLCEKSGILSEIKNHQFYEKPCEIRKRKNIQARRKSTRYNYNDNN